MPYKLATLLGTIVLCRLFKNSVGCGTKLYQFNNLFSISELTSKWQAWKAVLVEVFCCAERSYKNSCSHEPFFPLKYTSCYSNILHVHFKTSIHDTTARFELYVDNKLDGYLKMLLFHINRQKKVLVLKSIVASQY